MIYAFLMIGSAKLVWAQTSSRFTVGEGHSVSRIDEKLRPGVDCLTLTEKIENRMELTDAQKCKEFRIQIKRVEREYLNPEKIRYKVSTITENSFNDLKDKERLFSSAQYGELKITDLNDDDLVEIIKNRVGRIKLSSAADRWKYAANEGLAGGRLDFYGIARGYGPFIMFRGKVYNAPDFGNLLWALAMKNLGFSYAAVKSGSETNAFFNAKKQNPGIGKGVSWEGDSPEDQAAIKAGFDSGIEFKFDAANACSVENVSLMSKFALVLFGKGDAK